VATHSASLRKQLILHFDDVLDARFEFDHHIVHFYVKFSESADIQTARRAVRTYLDEHRALGCPVTLEETWVEGPSGPASFERLSPDDRRLLEGCSGTGSDIEGLIPKRSPGLVARGLRRPPLDGSMSNWCLRIRRR
jgi:hypothetical protein